MVKFVWLGFVCCGAANSVIYSYVQSQEKYVYMFVILGLCSLLVLIHRYCTDWIEDNRDYDEEHFPIFTSSSVIAIGFALISLIIGYVGVSLGLITAGIGFALASVRESMYV